MTDYRLRNQDLLIGQHRPPPSLAMIGLFAAIGFVAIFAVIGHLVDRFNPASGFNPTPASLIAHEEPATAALQPQGPVSDGSGS